MEEKGDMEQVHALVEKVKKGDSSAQSAASKLVAIGAPAVPTIISAIRQSDLGAGTNLARILLLSNDPAIVPTMIELLDDKHNTLRRTAFQALSQFDDGQIFQILVDKLIDPKNVTSDRAWAARALGELGDSRANDEFVRIVEEIANEGRIDYYADLVIPITVASAKLGEQTLAPYVVELAQTDDLVIKTNAVKALKYLVSPSLFSVLQAALQNEMIEICQDAMDALFYLGAKESVDELVEMTGSEYFDVANAAFFRIYDITGQLFDEDAKTAEVRDWWKEHRNEYETGVCYRSGAPIWLPNIIALMAEEPGWLNVLVQELQIITGHNFGLNPFIHLTYQDLDPVAELAQIWWNSEGHQYKKGVLYKCGYEHDVNRVFVDTG